RTYGNDFGAQRVRPDERSGPAGTHRWDFGRSAGGLLSDVAVGTPQLLAGLLVERGNELLLLVVTEDEELIAAQRRGSAGAELEVNRIGFERRVPQLLALEVER